MISLSTSQSLQCLINRIQNQNVNKLGLLTKMDSVGGNVK